MPTKNIRVYNTDGYRFYNLYNVEVMDAGNINWNDVADKLPKDANLDRLRTDYDEIDENGNLL